ncbi:glycosyltransferase [Marinitenerispora sediminis]|uniref:Glycosyl transferase family 1 n=1 Tax=Marinitenerispora sediminis TaxID=1931232 RepID=A0A368T409_9ACTN|nr:glycosyltransferase [Marinitenerispora sediminis]RCV49627.1 glycosyl transferase family 1 [Marinitenerispora sediminis]RCV53123.1 glycosyl transferase family 1 [Marinitenerispora sediminis]RCV57167.1 glycosyl transferase family 1 [Marinitenerispora sediminis]
MKIALVSEHTRPLSAHRGEPTCGGSVHVSSLARQLARLGHRVTVYARRGDSALPDRARMGRGVTVAHLAAGPPRTLTESESAEHTGAFATALAEALVDDAPEVVHAFGWTSGLAALSAVRREAAEAPTPPVVQSFHSLNVAEQRAGLPRRDERVRLEAALAGRADAVVVTSAEQRFELARMGVPRTSVGVIPFGVDTEHFTVEGATAASPWRRRRDERVRIVSVTRLGTGGGAEALVETMSRVPEAELVIAGGPARDDLAIDPDARRLELLAKEHGVDDRVTLVGAVDRKELPRLLRSADVFVSAAGYEPYGGAVLEAMSCGLPVVARAAGGVTDAVLDGTTGILLRHARPDALGRAIRQLAADPTSRTAFGIAAADRAASRFTWQRVASETERVYRRALPQEGDLPLAAGDDAH